MTTEVSTRGMKAHSKRRSAVLLSLAVGAALAALVALAGHAQRAEAASPEKVVFASDRTTGTGVRQLTFNKADRGGQERHGPLYTSQARKEVRQ